jgi:hypothetical protein
MRHPPEMNGCVRHIRPIYGWGWVDAEGATRDTPEPFKLGCDHPCALEGIVLGGHEFSGATAYLSSRHTKPHSLFNVEIKRDGVSVARGYAEG